MCYWTSLNSRCSCLVTKSCPTLRSSMYCSVPDFPVHHCLPEFAQKFVHWVSDAIQQSYPLSPPSLALNFSWIRVFSNELALGISGQTIRASASASVLPLNIQGWFPLGLTGWISLLPKGLSRVFFNTTVQKNQFFSTKLSLWSNSHIHTWPLEKPQLWLNGPLLAK